MDQSKKVLPGFLLADLYRNNLVVLEEKEPSPVSSEKKEGQWFLGNNNKQITILVHESTAVYLEDAGLEFLSSILGACKLNLGDVAIVNVEKTQVTYADLKAKLNPRHLLVFDVPATSLQLPFVIPHYQIQLYDQCQFLLAPSLQVLVGNSQEAKLEKSKLWLCLKKMFQL